MVMRGFDVGMVHHKSISDAPVKFVIRARMKAHLLTNAQANAANVRDVLTLRFRVVPYGLGTLALHC